MKDFLRPSSLALCLLVVLASVSAPSSAAPAPPEPAGRARAQAAESAAAYQFALAKLLSVEGDLAASLGAYETAEELDPGAAYIRLEHAQLLARLAQFTRNPSARRKYLEQAAEQIEQARRLDAENLDVLRAVGAIYLDLAADDPASLAIGQAAFEELLSRDPADVSAALTLGRLYLDQNAPEKAAAVFRALIERVPGQRMAYSLLIEALLRAEQPAEAEKALRDMIALDPDSMESRLALAELLGGRGEHGAAMEVLSGIPEELRADPRVRRQLAWSQYLTGDLDSALASLEPLLAENADDRGLRLLKGLILTAEGRSTEALALLQGLQPEGEGRDLALSLTVADLLVRSGRQGEAVSSLAGLAESLEREGRGEEAQEVRLELARVLLEGERWAELDEALAPLLSLEPGPARLQAVLLLAEALAEQGRHPEALERLAAEGDSPAVGAKRAEVLLRAGREDEARERIAELTRAGGTPSTLAAAQAYHRLERYGESVPMLEALVGREPASVVGRFLLGVAYERTGRREPAVEQFQEVLKLDPDFHPALNYLGFLYAEAGENLEEALSLVRRAVALDPDSGAYVDSLGWAHHRLGQHDEARSYLERAVRLEPEDATLHEHLGDVYVALGQKERARDAYQRALALEGDNADSVRRKLAGLEEGPPGR